MKIFVTGLSGTGKTTFAKKYSQLHKIDYINFDKIFDYTKKSKQQTLYFFNDIFSNKDYIIDAIPFGTNKWDEFLDYCLKHKDVFVVVAFCGFSTWIRRLEDKNFTNFTRDIDRCKKVFINMYSEDMLCIKDYIKIYFNSELDQFSNAEQLNEEVKKISE